MKSCKIEIVYYIKVIIVDFFNGYYDVIIGSVVAFFIGKFFDVILCFFKKIWNTIRGKKELEPTGNNQDTLKGLDLKSVTAPIYIMTGSVVIQHPPNEDKANSKKEDDK